MWSPTGGETSALCSITKPNWGLRLADHLPPAPSYDLILVIITRGLSMIINERVQQKNPHFLPLIQQMQLIERSNPIEVGSPSTCTAVPLNAAHPTACKIAPRVVVGR